MKTLICVCFMLLPGLAYCCSCSPMPDYKALNDLKGYDFIALAKVTQRQYNMDKSQPYWRYANGKITISIIELFKGEKVNVVVDPSFNTSCDLGVEAGEEWLLLGRKRNDTLFVSSCDYSIRYRDKSGLRSWDQYGGIRQLETLRTIFNHSSAIKNISQYAGGQIEYRQTLANGKLQGKREIYYPSGVRFVEETFDKGIPTGERRVYSPSGQLTELTIYKKGLIQRQTGYYDTTEVAERVKMSMWLDSFRVTDKSKLKEPYLRVMDTLRKQKNWTSLVQYNLEYAPDGRSYKREFYDYRGNLESKSYLDWNKKLTEYWRYDKRGKLSVYTKYDQQNDVEIEYDYRPDGTRRDFVKKCESCRYYFNAEAPPEATPAKAYVQ